MKSEDLFEEIGNIDEEILERAEKKRTHRRWIVPAAAAACLMLAVASIPLLGELRHEKYLLWHETSEQYTNDVASGVTSLGEIAPYITEVTIYYCDDNMNIQSVEREMQVGYENVLEAWRELNGIGSEVEITVKVEDNGEEFFTGSVAGYIAPTYFKAFVTVSAEIENYLTEDNSEAVLTALERTLRGQWQFDEYTLTIE